MKNLFLTFFFALFISVNAQSEIVNNFKNLVKKEMFKEANSLIPKIDTLELNFPTYLDHLVDRTTLFSEEKNLIEAYKIYQKMKSFEGKNYFIAKKDGKKVFFNKKSEAKKYGDITTEHIDNFFSENAFLVISNKVIELNKSGIKHLQSKYYENSSEIYSTIVDFNSFTNKRDPRINNYAAMSYMLLENYEKATLLFQTLIDNYPNAEYSSYFAFNPEGEKILLSQTEFEELKNSYTKLREFDAQTLTFNNLENTFEKLVYSYYRILKYKEAFDTANKGLEKYPDNVKLKKFRSVIIAKAIEAKDLSFEPRSMIEKYPDVADNYYNLAISQINDEKKYDENLTLLKTAIDKGIDNQNAYIQLVKLYIKKDNEFIEVINQNLGTSSRQLDKKEEYTEKRFDLYKNTILPILIKGKTMYPNNATIEKYLSITNIYIEKNSQTN